MRLRCFVASMLFCLTACDPVVQVVDVDHPQRLMPGKLEAECNRLYLKNERGRRKSWKGHLPIVYMVEPGFPAEFVPVLRAAMKTYNDAAGFELFRLDGYGPFSGLPRLDRCNTIGFLRDDGGPDPRREQLREELAKEHGIAMTHIFSVGNRIVDTDIIFDGKTRSFSNSRLRLGSYDFEKVALHELGHALGLGHNDDEFFSVMFPEALPIGIAIRTLDETTTRLLQCEYP